MAKPKKSTAVESTVVQAAMTTWDKGFILGVEFGVRRSEDGDNLQMALAKAQHTLKSIRSAASKQ